MDLSYVRGTAVSERADALVVAVPTMDGEPQWPTEANELDANLDGELLRLAAEARFVGKRGTTFGIPTLGRAAPRRVVLVGLGPLDNLDAAAVGRAWGAA
ncbi:MAG: hypothetical protein M3Q10_06315, partial [Chloroflexota bacterium]|nr:hypothetical protein [Chloroflexota bacterium]